MKGYVYIAKNKALPGMIKIGRSKTLSGRMKSLSNASIPQKFELVFSVFSDFSLVVEREAHASLGAYRISPNREFFSCSEELAIETIEKVAANIRLTPPGEQEAGRSTKKIQKQPPEKRF